MPTLTHARTQMCPPPPVPSFLVTFSYFFFCNHSLGSFDVVLMANLLCRLPKPYQCLARLGGENGIVNVGGHVVLASPFTWLEQFTLKEDWVGGDGVTTSRDALVASMDKNGFKLVTEDDIPFCIRETARKYQTTWSHYSVFKRHT